jgi:hypothetical protein
MFPVPVGAARFPRTPVMFPPECGGVSAGYRGVPPEGGRRLPRVPCAAVPMGPAPESAAALFPPCDPFRGRPHDRMIQQRARPAVSR